jgi:hypothetical protein
MTTTAAIKNVKPGEYVQLKENGPFWVRGAYDKSSKKFELSSCDDVNKVLYRKGTVEVVIGATY